MAATEKPNAIQCHALTTILGAGSMQYVSYEDTQRLESQLIVIIIYMLSIENIYVYISYSALSLSFYHISFSINRLIAI